MVICIKQHLSDKLSKLKKAKQHRGWVEKSIAYQKCL